MVALGQINPYTRSLQKSKGLGVQQRMSVWVGLPTSETVGWGETTLNMYTHPLEASKQGFNLGIQQRTSVWFGMPTSKVVGWGETTHMYTCSLEASKHGFNLGIQQRTSVCVGSPTSKVVGLGETILNPYTRSLVTDKQAWV